MTVKNAIQSLACRAIYLYKIASWCNGSTRDSGSLCLGSNPSEAATSFPSVKDKNEHLRTLSDVLNIVLNYGYRCYRFRQPLALLVCLLYDSRRPKAEKIHKRSQSLQSENHCRNATTRRRHGGRTHAYVSPRVRPSQRRASARQR